MISEQHLEGISVKDVEETIVKMKSDYEAKIDVLNTIIKLLKSIEDRKSTETKDV